MITGIMHMDNGYDDLSPRDRKMQRQQHLKEKVDDYFAWAKVKYDQVTKNSTIGKALAYSINQEEYLRKFLNLLFFILKLYKPSICISIGIILPACLQIPCVIKEKKTKNVSKMSFCSEDIENRDSYN